MVQTPELVDVLVVGSGAGGLSAALRCASAGLSVLVAEKTGWLGGTTALSEGMIWVPAGRAARESNASDSVEAALEYLRCAAPGTLDEARASAYCNNAAAMLDFLESQIGIRFQSATSSGDYFAELPGATIGIRSYRPCDFDARRFGRLELHRIRPPLATTTAFAGMMLSYQDYQHVLRMRSSVRSFGHVARLAIRYGIDRARGYSRGSRLTNGNALVASLIHALRQRGVDVHTEAEVVALDECEGRIAGATLQIDGRPHRLGVRHGVVLATGGFPGPSPIRDQHLAPLVEGVDYQSLAPETNTGDGISLAISVGAEFTTNVAQLAAWTPVSLVPQRDGSRVPFPHYVDRAKPGVIVVSAQGDRFCNEADPYHRFVPQLLRASRASRSTHVWLIADRRAIRKYGLGAVPPAPMSLKPFVANGYLIEGNTWSELADKLAIPAARLQTTISRFNADAARGIDSQFGRGSTEFNRAYGDTSHAPNPCMGPLQEPPFYAIALVAGDIGTFAGLVVDAYARVMRPNGSHISGLYAAGNDIASPTGGEYPAAGVTVGSALTFGYIAGTQLAAQALRVDP